MALPVAHASIALGLARTRRIGALAFVSLLSVSPDFDFMLVWGLELPVEAYHRTFSHSILLYAALTLAWRIRRPAALKCVSPLLFLAVLSSHSLYDMLCTADASDHGVMLFWPLVDNRFGWPVFVPLYRVFADSPFTWSGAAAFTLLECLLAWPFWRASRLMTRKASWSRVDG